MSMFIGMSKAFYKEGSIQVLEHKLGWAVEEFVKVLGRL